MGDWQRDVLVAHSLVVKRSKRYGGEKFRFNGCDVECEEANLEGDK